MSYTLENKQGLWISILFNPGAVFQTQLNKLQKYMWLLIIVGCIWHNLNAATRHGSATTLISTFLVNALISLCIGWVFFYIQAAIISWCASLVGGTGTVKSTYAVFVWSFAPGVLVILSYALSTAIWGNAIIMKSTAVGNLSLIRNCLLGFNGMVFLWSLYILINGVMSVHSLSFAKALVALLLPVLIPLILLLSLLGV